MFFSIVAEKETKGKEYREPAICLSKDRDKEMGGEILWKSEESCGNMVVENAGLCYNSEERNCSGYGLNGRRMVSFLEK